MILQFRKTICLSVKQKGHYHSRTFHQMETIEAQIVPLTSRHIIINYEDGELNVSNELVVILL